MKRCPECRRDYYDDTLSYCLDDGNALLEGPASGSGADDDVRTAIFSDQMGAAPGRYANEEQTVTLALPQTETNKNSIAVLPFVNISADADNEYFCDGLAEELLNALSKIEGLKVAARTSAFSFKGKDVSAGEIGTQLGVKNILEGSVRRSGDRLRISVQLVNAQDGFRIWSERYDREMRDIFAVQDEIALAVVGALKLRLLGRKAAVLNRGTENAEAYELYLMGRSLWNRRTSADLEKAITYFEQAIAIDPNYAVAYSGLADCYSFLGYFEAVAPKDVMGKARAAIRMAVEHNNDFAEIHASFAIYKLFFEFDNRICEAELRKAMEINPNFAAANYWLCSVLAAQTRFDEAWVLGGEAARLDPLSPVVAGNIARALCHARMYEKAIEVCLKSLEIVPDFFFTEWVLGVAYSNSGRSEKGIEYLRSSILRSGSLALKSDLGVALATCGDAHGAKAVLLDLEAAALRQYVSPLSFAKIFFALGDLESGWTWLDKASQTDSIQLLWLATEPVYDGIRDDPRFRELLRKYHFPEAAIRAQG